MTDMTPVIAAKSDQISADDLITGPITIQIERVKISNGADQPVQVHLVGMEKVYRPCKSMARVMVAAWGPDSSKYVGRSMTLYRDPKVKWGGMEVGGIRISAMSDLSAPLTMALTETRASRKPFTVKPLAASPASQPATAARQTAEEWVAEYVARVAACADLGALAALQQRSETALGKLKASRPELYQQAVDAGTKRASDLSAPEPAGEDLPFEEEVA